MSTRIGILTGGGDCPGLNGVIRAVTLHARQTFGWEVVGIRNGFEGLYEEEYIDLVPSGVQHLLSRGGTMLGSSNRANPFAYPVKLPDGRVEIHDVSARCLSNLQKLDLHGLIVVGGDGTMSFAQKFMQRGAPRIVGVPKTIDNDLEATDYTVGFQTAVEIVVQAIERLHTTAESHERIMIVEVMGRYAGWIALTSALAGGAHVCLIPEIDYDPDRVIDAFHRRHGRGVSYSIVVVSEGAKAKGGALSVVSAGDATKQEKLGGAGQRLADMIGQKTDYEVRTTVLGHVQRGGSPCAFDRELATRFGVKAVELVAEGKFGHVAAVENGRLVAKSIEKAVKKLKLIDPAGELVRTAKGVGIELGGMMRALLVILALLAPSLASAQGATKRMDLDFKQAPLADLLQIVGDTARLNIVIVDGADTKLDIAVKAMPWADVLDDVVKRANLASVREGSVVIVGPQTVIDERKKRKKRTYAGPVIDLDLVAVEAADAARLVAMASGRPFKLDAGKQAATLRLKRTPVEQAQELLVLQTGATVVANPTKETVTRTKGACVAAKVPTAEIELVGVAAVGAKRWALLGTKTSASTFLLASTDCVGLESSRMKTIGAAVVVVSDGHTVTTWELHPKS